MLLLYIVSKEERKRKRKKFGLTSGVTASDCGEASISRGCIKGRPIAIAVCTSSGNTTLSSNFSRFGKARSTANRYLSK